MEKQTNNQMTLEKLATLMQQGFLESENKFEGKLEKLAILTQQGFLELKDKINNVETELKGEINSVKSDINDIKADLSDIKTDLKDLKNEVSGHMDHVYKKLEDLSLENKSGFLSYKRQDEKLIDHENRLILLEQKK